MERADHTAENTRRETLIEEFYRLMECQLVGLRAGNVSQVEVLGRRMTELVAQIMQTSPDVSATAGRRGVRLWALCQELELALCVEKKATRDKLKRLRQIKKLVAAGHAGMAFK
jgi:hypothetical protein